MSYANRNEAFLASWIQRIQELEDAAYDTLMHMSIASAYGDLLTKIGQRVGEARQGMSDAEYRAAVRIRIRVNRSNGRATDIIDVASLAAVNGTTPRYSEAYPAGWVVEIENLPGGVQVARLLGEAAAAGTRGVLVFTPDADPYAHFGWAGDALHDASELWPYAPTSDPPNLWAMSAEA